MSGKDRRQLAAMRKQLNHYIAGELPLQGLIGDLEEVYAVSLDMKERQQMDQKLTDEPVQRLVDLVQTRQHALDEPDA